MIHEFAIDTPSISVIAELGTPLEEELRQLEEALDVRVTDRREAEDNRKRSICQRPPWRLRP
jgi:hypothetical protein